jgi:periplasmic divalent cation tolerance protein
MDVLIVLTTVATDADADSIARRLVDEKLAACVSVMAPMRSTYRWQGKLETESERQLVIKTSPDRLDALRQALLAIHPYDTPELLVLEAAASEGYLAWLREAVR